MDHDEWASTPFPRYTDEQEAEILRRSPLVDVVAEHTTINRKPDGTYVGVCLFCRANTLEVNPADGRWFCPTCLETGDVLIFVVKVRDLWRADALKWLADRAGIDAEAGE